MAAKRIVGAFPPKMAFLRDRMKQLSSLLGSLMKLLVGQ